MSIKIVSTAYPYGRFSLLCSYLYLVFKSYRLSLAVRKSHDVQYIATICGYSICFKNYPEFIFLLEEIFIHQVYDFKIKSHASGINIIDVGSNIGLSVLYFNKRFPDCHVIAFEPASTNFVLLKQNITSNHLTNVEMYPIAISEKKGINTLYKNSSTSAINWSLEEKLVGGQSQQVESDALSNYMDGTKTYLLKLDVEGAESRIVKSLVDDELIRKVDAIIVEVHPDLTGVSVEELSALLKGSGFRVIEKESPSKGAPETMLYAKR